MNKHKRHILRQRQQERGTQKQAPIKTAAAARSPVQIEAACVVIEEPTCSIIPYGENLLERSRTQWQFGDWDTLAQLSRDTLQHHPDRAKLALLAAAGLLQKGDTSTARQYVRLAQDWGCSKKLVSQILVAGVHNSLGRAAAATRNETKALKHFAEAVRGANADDRLISQARSVHEITRMGLLPQAAEMVNKELQGINQEYRSDKLSSQITILKTEVELLHHELSLAQQRQQLFNNKSDEDSQKGGTWLEKLKMRSVSQLGQDLWVLEKTNYKRGGYFVEFGATDGVLLSNTWLMEKEFGWRGICAEPNPIFFEQLKKNRNCIVSPQYIGKETGEMVDFVLADVYGGSLEFAGSDHHEEKRNAYTTAGHVTTFTSISLNDFLEQHHAPCDIDYISIDTEGSEYDLLSSFPFDRWSIRLLTIEHNFAEQRQKIRALLESKGYRCVEQQWDDWYERVD